MTAIEEERRGEGRERKGRVLRGRGERCEKVKLKRARERS
jgi:hypothetical protein